MLLLLLEYNFRVKCENAVQGVSCSFSGMSAGVCLFLLLLKYNFHFECENTVEGVSRFLSRMCAGMCCANSSYTELLLSVRVLLKGSHALLAGRAQVCVAFIA